MALTQEQKAIIEETADHLLKRTKTTRAPIEVEKVASAIGLKVEYYPFPDEISGLLKKELGVIGINSTQNERRQRFTLAHEIGHYVLGHEIIRGSDLVDGANTDTSSPNEREANYFASVLLMPGDFVRKEVKKKLKIRPLSNLFEVSEQAMTIRMLELRIIFQHD